MIPTFIETPVVIVSFTLLINKQICRVWNNRFLLFEPHVTPGQLWEMASQTRTAMRNGITDPVSYEKWHHRPGQLWEMASQTRTAWEMASQTRTAMRNGITDPDSMRNGITDPDSYDKWHHRPGQQWEMASQTRTAMINGITDPDSSEKWHQLGIDFDLCPNSFKYCCVALYRLISEV